jgi:hypothetical protein
VTVDRGSAPALTLLDAKGNYAKDDKGNELSDVTPDQARQGISVPQGKYSLQFASGSGYNGSLPVTLDTDNQTVDLSRSMSFFRIVPARDVPLQGANVSDSSGTYQFSLSSDAAGKTEALPPGRYLLTFNDNGGSKSLPRRELRWSTSRLALL